MHARSFYIVLFFSLICLLALPRVLPAKAIAPSTHAGRSYQTITHSVVIPQKINTATLKHSTLTPSRNSSRIAQSASISNSSNTPIVPYPPNVVNVPVATTTDSTAKVGQSVLNQPQPDASGAGGINNYLETVEGGIAVYTRSGTQQLTSTYQTWFNLPSAQFLDPVTIWDDTGDRFIFSVIEQGTSNIMVSVAQQGDATGSYCNYTLTNLSGQNFDHLGVNADGIYVSANILSQSSSQVVNNELFSASRTAMESCQSVTSTSWTGLLNRDGILAKSVAPAVEDGSTPGFEYLVNSFPAGACEVTLWTLTSASVLSAFTVPTQCYNPPVKAKQKGSSSVISTGDCSITQASLVNGLLTFDTPGAYDWGDGRGQVSIVEWFVINPSTNSVANEGAFGTPGYWLFYPSAVTTANGNMLFVYNVSGASIYPSVWYINQTMTGTTALANGTSYYTYGGLHVSPWGAYQSAWPDTSSINANAVWITGEYVASTNVWGTKFDLVTP